jgi:hypothetical protein
MRGSTTLMAVALTFALGSATPGRAETAEPIGGADVKAAYLLNFAKFIDWAAAERPLVICGIAAGRYADAIARVVDRRVVNGRAIVTRQLSSRDDPATCDVAYIGALPAHDLAQSLHRLRGRPTLTVGEGLAFLRDGGIIALYMEGDRLRFAVSAANAKSAGLTVSSRLLALASP